MRASYTRKTIKGIAYTLFTRQDERKYADRTVKILKEDGYRAVILPDPHKVGGFEIWRSVNKVGQRGKGKPYFK